MVLFMSIFQTITLHDLEAPMNWLISYGVIYQISKNNGLLNFKVNRQNNNSLASLGYKTCSVCCKAFNFETK